MVLINCLGMCIVHSAFIRSKRVLVDCLGMCTVHLLGQRGYR